MFCLGHSFPGTLLPSAALGVPVIAGARAGPSEALVSPATNNLTSFTSFLKQTTNLLTSEQRR